VFINGLEPGIRAFKTILPLDGGMDPLAGALSPTVWTALAVLGVITGAGVLTGVAGFGFAVVGTTVLVTLLEPATAVVVLVIPLLATNLVLLDELSRGDIDHCGRRFAPLIGGVIGGTIVGMVALDGLPADVLRLALGVLALATVGVLQQRVPLPGRAEIRDRCVAESRVGMAAVGLGSGLIFGATNVGVQLVTYLKSCDLEHRLFVGVVALVFVGVNALRSGVALVVGLYPSPTVALGSAALAVPAVAGAALGRRLRGYVAERWRRWTVLAILILIGGRLVSAGL